MMYRTNLITDTFRFLRHPSFRKLSVSPLTYCRHLYALPGRISIRSISIVAFFREFVKVNRYKLYYGIGILYK